MDSVVTVNLNGNAFQLELSAHDALRAYLDRAATALADNPDRAEILRDLEQAIAEKCATYLSAHKTVVAGIDMGKILAEMGPVEGDQNAGEKVGGAQAESGPRKRLYRIKDGAMISGVCAGLGAYLNVDATFIRFAVVILTFLTSGWLILFYVLAMFLIPSAHTSAEWAAAHGVPFNAQEIIDRAKREYSQFTESEDSKVWRADWGAAINERTRSWSSSFQNNVRPPAPMAPSPSGNYFTRLVAGILAVVFGLVGAALTIAFLIVLFSLITTHSILGWDLPGGLPFWVGIVVAAVAFAAVSAPVNALQRASSATATGAPDHGDGGNLVGLVLFILVGYFLYTQVPEARAWMDQVAAIFREVFQDLRAAFVN